MDMYGNERENESASLPLDKRDALKKPSRGSDGFLNEGVAWNRIMFLLAELSW